MTMTTLPARVCPIIVIALAILTVIAATPVPAQQLGPDGAPNPTASAVSEEQLLQQAPRIEGQIDIPNEREHVLFLPVVVHGCDFLNKPLRWFGAIVILG